MLNLADVVFRVGRAYGMTADRGIYQAVAVKDGRITAVGRSRDELDSFIGPGTAVIDDPELVLYPAFNDTHNHQLLAARDLDYVSLEQARSIDELVQALRGAADRTPAGEWVISSRCWHETHLREGRLPTARELDAASARHPVFVQRGGHVGVANSAALRMAGITATSADPPSGTVVRLGDRTPVGVLIEGGALEPVRRPLPPVSEAAQAELLARQCRLYNRRGIGVVRDPGLVPGEVAVCQRVAAARGRLEFDQGPDGRLITGGAGDLEPGAAGDPHAVTVEPRAGVKALGQDPAADNGFGFRRLSLFHEVQYRHEV
jgi:predicted amidohydrolase YtcJ